MECGAENVSVNRFYLVHMYAHEFMWQLIHARIIRHIVFS